VNIATLSVTGGCKMACEDMAGYDTTMNNTVLPYYAPGTGKYESDTVFTDQDQDRFGVCIDAIDTDPRVGAQYVGAETLCDGIDNNHDGVVDNGLTGCNVDHDQKRLHQANLFQGDEDAMANVVEGNLLRTEVDAVVHGPYGPLVLSRSYNSRRGSNDADLGVGWTHSFAVYLMQMVAGDDRWRVQLPSGESSYYRCNGGRDPGLPAEVQCAIDDHRPQGNLLRTGGTWYYLPGDGTSYAFSDTLYSGRGRVWQTLVDGAGAGFTIATAVPDTNGRVTR
jgi:hypothetical protein